MDDLKSIIRESYIIPGAEVHFWEAIYRIAIQDETIELTQLVEVIKETTSFEHLPEEDVDQIKPSTSLSQFVNDAIFKYNVHTRSDKDKLDEKKVVDLIRQSFKNNDLTTYLKSTLPKSIGVLLGAFLLKRDGDNMSSEAIDILALLTYKLLNKERMLLKNDQPTIQNVIRETRSIVEHALEPLGLTRHKVHLITGYLLAESGTLLSEKEFLKAKRRGTYRNYLQRTVANAYNAKS